MPRVLLIGYGNPGRGDDGLGPALAERIGAMNLPGVTMEVDYQLTVDHTASLAVHDLVIFADAAIGLPVAFRMSALADAACPTLSSHALSPSAVLHLTRLLYGRAPQGWLMAIAGTDFDMVREGLSAAAQENLARAIPFLTRWMEDQEDTAAGSGLGGLVRAAPGCPMEAPIP